MQCKDGYLYILSGKDPDRIEMVMKTPTFVKKTSFINIPGTTSVLELNRIIKLMVFKRDDCWYFTFGKTNSEAAIPSDWTLLVRETLNGGCSPAIWIYSKSAIVIKATQALSL